MLLFHLVLHKYLQIEQFVILDNPNASLEYSRIILCICYTITRKNDIDQVKKLQSIFPVTALLGARQTGKTTLAKQLIAQHYFDLENPVDRLL